MGQKYQIPIRYWYFLGIPNFWLPIGITKSKFASLWSNSVLPETHSFLFKCSSLRTSTVGKCINKCINFKCQRRPLCLPLNPPFDIVGAGPWLCSSSSGPRAVPDCWQQRPILHSEWSLRDPIQRSTAGDLSLPTSLRGDASVWHSADCPAPCELRCAGSARHSQG